MLYHTMNCRQRSSGLPLWLCGLLFIMPLRSDAQNLVFNHSFELYDTCAVVNDVYYPDTGPLGWFSAAGTPDHMISCLPYGQFNSVPLNFVAFQYPQDGECYGHVTTYRGVPPDIREYFMVHLTEPLVIGEQYHASFYASVAWGGYPMNPPVWLYTNGIGMTFTTQPRQWHLNDPYPTPWNFAQVYTEEMIIDTIGWTLISGTFVADSAYQYVILGNSFDNANTDTMHIGGPFGNAQIGGVLIDNVCVSPESEGCDMAVTIEERRGSNWRIYPNPAQGWLVFSNIGHGKQIIATDLQGRTIWEGTMGGDSMLLDVTTWPRGSYLLRWGDKDGEGWFKRILTE